MENRVSRSAVPGGKSVRITDQVGGMLAELNKRCHCGTGCDDGLDGTVGNAQAVDALHLQLHIGVIVLSVQFLAA